MTYFRSSWFSTNWLIDWLAYRAMDWLPDHWTNWLPNLRWKTTYFLIQYFLSPLFRFQSPDVPDDGIGRRCPSFANSVPSTNRGGQVSRLCENHSPRKSYLAVKRLHSIQLYSKSFKQDFRSFILSVSEDNRDLFSVHVTVCASQLRVQF